MSARIDQVSSPAAADGGPGTAEINVWIIGDDDEVIVIDPGSDAAAVLDVVGEREVLAVICTHGHAAHVAAAIEVAERDEAAVARLRPLGIMCWRKMPSKVKPKRNAARRDGALSAAHFHS